MLLRFLEDKAFSRDGVTVIRVHAGEEAVVPPRLAARYLAEGVAVDVKARPAAPENKAVESTTPPPAAAAAGSRGRGARGSRGRTG